VPLDTRVRKMMTTHRPTAKTVAEFLQQSLADGAIDVSELEAMARGAGLLGKRQKIQHSKTLKMAKKSLGIRSIRDGFGSKGKLAWFCRRSRLSPQRRSRIAKRTRTPASAFDQHLSI